MDDSSGDVRPSKRGNGYGTVYQRADGRWVAQYHVGAMGRRKRKALYRHTEREARAALHAALGWTLDASEIELEEGEGYVYFLQGVGGGPIKIGRTDNVDKRAKVIQECSPVPLKILYVLSDTDRKTERKIHNKFKMYRLHGEWFEPGHALLAYIDDLRTQSPSTYDGRVLV